MPSPLCSDGIDDSVKISPAQSTIGSHTVKSGERLRKTCASMSHSVSIRPLVVSRP